MRQAVGDDLPDLSIDTERVVVDVVDQWLAFHEGDVVGQDGLRARDFGLALGCLRIYLLAPPALNRKMGRRWLLF